MSGHIFFNENWYGFDDAIYTALRCLQEINFRKDGLEGFIVNLYQSLFQALKLELNVKKKKNLKLLKILKTFFKKYHLSDLLLIDG